MQVEKLENITFSDYELGDDPPDIVLERDDGIKVGMEIDLPPYNRSSFKLVI
jgi:hypothetical protein